VLRLWEELPVVVEIVDAEDKIEAFLPTLDRLIGDGLVTLEKVRVIAYRHNSGTRYRRADSGTSKRSAAIAPVFHSATGAGRLKSEAT